jgi:predicted transcriptional regulator of viral defense system
MKVIKNYIKKVEKQMTKLELAKNVLKASAGIAKTSDFVVAGLAKSDVCDLTNKGSLERVRHGFYKLAGNYKIPEAQYLATLLPGGVVCVESALFHYGYSDFAPRFWTIAVLRTISQTKLRITAVPIRPYYIQPKLYELGKTSAKIDDVLLSIYDRERTICDCFKYRTKMDNETFNKAINAYVVDDNRNLGNLASYAKEMHLWKKIDELMEVLLNG